MKTTTITATLDDDEAAALAQFLKRIGWSEWRVCATSDEEAYTMRAACEAIARALASAGHAPR